MRKMPNEVTGCRDGGINSGYHLAGSTSSQRGCERCAAGCVRCAACSRRPMIRKMLNEATGWTSCSCERPGRKRRVAVAPSPQRRSTSAKFPATRRIRHNHYPPQEGSATITIRHKRDPPRSRSTIRGIRHQRDPPSEGSATRGTHRMWSRLLNHQRDASDAEWTLKPSEGRIGCGMDS